MPSVLEAAAADRAPPAKKPLPEDTQQVCIDLPGEIIRCVVFKPKLEIMLRKHRDVIFDIALFSGMQYTVEADKSDFYNARDKKIVLATKKQKVTFTDGERMHLHISREFTGHLILKANGKILGRYSPNELDSSNYGSDPASKPAPLIIAMKNTNDPTTNPNTAASSQSKPDDPLGLSKTWQLSPLVLARNLDESIKLGRVAHAAVEPEHPTVAVVDVSNEGMPKQILEHFAKGGDKSGLVDIDRNDVMTRNWLYGQLAGSVAYAGDNWNWLRHSVNRQADGAFRLVSAKMAYVRGKARVYFTGYSKVNPAFGQGGHGPGNAKILQIYAGVGSTSSNFTAAAKSIGGTLKGNALASFVFGSAASWAEWQEDAQKDGYDLAATLLTGLVKALVAAVLVAVVVAFIVTAIMLFTTLTVAALAIGTFTIAASIVASYTVEAVDKKLGRQLTKNEKEMDGLATIVAPWLRQTGKSINENWDYLQTKIPTDYKELRY
jgi:hypothetical protein